MYSTLKAKAQELRRSGHLYSEIAEILGVAKSTAYVWTSGLTLTSQQQKALAQKLKTSKQDRIHLLAERRQQK